MSIIASDIHKHLSGGAANADVNASIGGIMSSVAIVDDSLHNLFDKVKGSEHFAGDTEYRCFYLQNAHATLTYEDPPSIYITTNTPCTDTLVSIGLSAQGKNATATAIANEGTAPAGVSFTEPSAGSPLSLGSDFAPGDYIGVWVRWAVTAGSAAYANDEVAFGTTGGTDV